MHAEKNSLENVPAIMAGLMLSLLLAALDNSIVATAMPKIIEDLQGMEYYSLPFTSYLLFSTVAIPIAGKLSDVFGRKVVILWGMTGFLVTSILCALSINMPMLITIRGLQGACGGVLASSTFIITAELFPPKQRAKYIGILASMHGLASLLGPVLGGVITEYMSWHWIFFINIPIGIAAIYLLNRHLSLLKHADANNSGLDVKGILVFLAAIFPFLICLTEGGRLLPWTSPLLFILAALSICLMIWFVKLEQKSHSPMLPSGLLKNKVFQKAAFAAAMGYVALFGLILYIPYILQIVLKKSVSFSGIMMLPMSLSMVVGGMIGGVIVSRSQRYRQSSIINFSIAIAGFAVLLFFGTDISMPLMVVALLLAGLGIGMNFPVVNIVPQAIISVAQMGILVSTIEFFQVMGGVLSTSVFGKMLSVSLPAILWTCIAALATGIITMSLLDEKAVHEGFAKQRNKES